MGIIDKFKLNDKVSIITGAATGLGKAMALALGEAGSQIVIADMNYAMAEQTAQELSSKGILAHPFEVDVTNEKQVIDLVAFVQKKFERIDVLINNAGIAIHEKAELMTTADWLKVVNVNLNGVFIVSREVGKVMIDQGSGSIINISSMSGFVVNTPQCQSSYNVSKAGVIMLTKSLAAEWASKNIRVNTIAPGYMKTEMTAKFFDGAGEMVKRWLDLTPMKRPGMPDELGGIALYLASDASSFATGGVFVVDGGYSVW